MNRRATPPFEQKHRRMRRCWPPAGAQHKSQVNIARRHTQVSQQTLVCAAGAQRATRRELLQEAGRDELRLARTGRPRTRSELRPDLSACGIFLAHVNSRLCHQYALSQAYLDTVRANPTLPSVRPGQTSQTTELHGSRWSAFVFHTTKHVDGFPDFQDNIKGCRLPKQTRACTHFLEFNGDHKIQVIRPRFT